MILFTYLEGVTKIATYAFKNNEIYNDKKYVCI